MSLASNFSDTRCQTTATIPNGTATTGEIDLGGTTLVGIMFPATMTQTTVKFSVSMSLGGTYQTMTDGAGSDISKTFASAKYLPLDPALFKGVRFLKLVVGGNEGADRALTIVSKPNV